MFPRDLREGNLIPMSQIDVFSLDLDTFFPRARGSSARTLCPRWSSGIVWPPRQAQASNSRSSVAEVDQWRCRLSCRKATSLAKSRIAMGDEPGKTIQFWQSDRHLGAEEHLDVWSSHPSRHHWPCPLLTRKWMELEGMFSYVFMGKLGKGSTNLKTLAQQASMASTQKLLVNYFHILGSFRHHCWLYHKCVILIG